MLLAARSQTTRGPFPLPCAVSYIGLELDSQFVSFNSLSASNRLRSTLAL